MTIMSHPQQADAFAAYGSYNGGGMPNRSPTSTRSGYATLPSGMGLSRQSSQRQQQQPQQIDTMGQQQPPSMAYPLVDRPMMDRYGILDSISRGPPTVSGMPGEYMTGNQTSWNYNGGSATVSGPVPDLRGGRTVNRRPGIPDYWMQQPDPTAQPALSLQTQQQQQPQQQQPQPVYPPQPMTSIPYGHMMTNLDQLRSQQVMFQDVRQAQDKKDDLIPTAIVIKNIPFNVRKEVLQALMMDLHLPQPYAFNYHFDNGVFRGLAFANFSSAEETRQVIDHLNGLEVHGRKLRVEYKKMLPEHERERIEREKRQKRGQLEEQHRPITLNHQPSLQSLIAQSAEIAPSRSSPNKDMPDLNDERTLEIYIKLRKYKEDRSKNDYLPFESSNTPEQRRLIHILAHNLGLHHESFGSAENRCTIVWKEGMPPAGLAMNTSHTPVSAVEQLQYPGNNKSLARAATIDFGEQRTSSSNGYGTIGRHGNPALELPEGSPDGLNSVSNLRTIRSMAELGRPVMQARTPSPRESAYPTNSLRLNEAGLSSRPDLSNAFGMATTPTTPGSTLNHHASDMSLAGITNNLSSLSVAEGPYETSSRPRETPGAIGSQRPGVNGLSSRNAPERQPRGPDNGWETSGGFGGRRVNGHVQRGSGSSNLTSSESYSDLLTGSRVDSADNYHGSGANSSLYSH